VLITDLTATLPHNGSWQRRTVPPDCIVIHHSVTRGNFSIERIAEFHIGRGYAGIAYHYVVDGIGRTFRTNSDMSFTWHGNGGNTGLGVCLLGDFTTAVPPEAQLAAAAELVLALRGQYGLLPVIGHREAAGAATACPGDAFTNEMVHAIGDTGAEMPRDAQLTKLAGHWQQPSNESASWLASALPPAIKCMGNVGPGDVQRLWGAYDAAGRARPLVLAREWTDDKRDEWVAAGALGARAWFERVRPGYERWRGISDVVVGVNEFIPWNADQMRALSLFDAEATRLCHSAGWRYVGGNFSVGWPELGMWQHYSEALGVIDFLGLHEYWWPGLPQDGWRALRYRRAMVTIRGLGYRLPPIIIGEVGWDEALLERPHRGGVSQPAYLDWLRWYDSEIAKDGGVVCACIFETGAAADWAAMGFDVVGSAIGGELATYIRSGNAEVVAPPAGGGVLIAAYDRDGAATTVAALRAKYGFTVRPAAEVAPGAEVFRVAVLREKTGPATLVVRTMAGGVADAGRKVAFSWPDAPAQPNTGHDWVNRYVTGATNENGDVGFGLGPGAYIQDIAAGGPHGVWVWSPSTASDAVFGLGMLGGTVHDHVDVEFALVKEAAVEPETPPTPTPPTPATPPIEAIRNAGWNAAGVDYNPDAALTEYGQDHGLGAPLGQEDSTSVPGYVVQPWRDCILYVKVNDWANVMTLEY
jgi:hypothetical protein